MHRQIAKIKGFTNLSSSQIHNSFKESIKVWPMTLVIPCEITCLNWFWSSSVGINYYCVLCFYFSCFYLLKEKEKPDEKKSNLILFLFLNPRNKAMKLYSLLNEKSKDKKKKWPYATLHFLILLISWWWSWWRDYAYTLSSIIPLILSDFNNRMYKI